MIISDRVVNYHQTGLIGGISAFFVRFFADSGTACCLQTWIPLPPDFLFPLSFLVIPKGA